MAEITKKPHKKRLSSELDNRLKKHIQILETPQFTHAQIYNSSTGRLYQVQFSFIIYLISQCQEV